MSRNGMYTAIKTNDGVAAVYIEEEVLELGKLNAITEQRRKANRRQIAINDQIRKDRKNEQIKKQKRWEREVTHLLKQELKVLAGAVAVYIALELGLVAAVLAVPVLITCQTVIVFRAGKYFGKYPVKWFK